MWYRRGALLFFEVIHQISRSHGLKNRWFGSNLSKITRPVAAIKSLRFALLFEFYWNMFPEVQLSTCHQITFCVIFQENTIICMWYVLSVKSKWWPFCVQWDNSSSSQKCGSNFKDIIFKLIIQNSSMGNHCEIVLRWMPQNLITNQWEINIGAGNGLLPSATNQYRSQYSTISLSPFGVTPISLVLIYIYYTASGALTEF